MCPGTKTFRHIAKVKAKLAVAQDHRRELQFGQRAAGRGTSAEIFGFAKTMGLRHRR